MIHFRYKAPILSCILFISQINGVAITEPNNFVWLSDLDKKLFAFDITLNGLEKNIIIDNI